MRIRVAGMCLSSISHSSLLETSQDDGKYKQSPSVIPAQAGIQWFR